MTRLTKTNPLELGLYYSNKNQDTFEKWSPGEGMKRMTIELCRTLNEGEVQAIDGEIELSWERMDYKDLIDEERLFWPGHVVHSKIIVNDRYVVPKRKYAVKERPSRVKGSEGVRIE